MKKESHLIEWKLNWRDEFIKWICGFANAHGGTLIIGRNDDGEVVGVDDAKKLLEDIPNKVRDILGIMVDVHLKKNKGKDLVEIRVDASPHPVSYKGQYQYRSGSTKQELKGSALDAFLLRKLGKHWDGVPMPGVKLKDLSKSAIKHFCQLAKESRRLDNSILKEPASSLLEKLGLCDGKYLKRAAVLLFHPNPESLVTGAYTKIGFFRSNSDLRFQDEINGDLFTQVDKTLDLLMTKYLNANISYRGVHRLETLPVPEAALREAVLNALIHKNYASGSPVQISVYPDKLMIWNSGTLPLDWTVEKLLGKHASEPYNPDIANTFFRAGLIEAWGRGYERILEACREGNAPEPQIRYETTGLWVEFALLKNGLPIGEFNENTQKNAGEVKGQVAGEVTGEVIRLLQACADTMSRKELLDKLNLKGAANFRELYLTPALNAGLIEMTIPNKPKSRLQKYRVSARGKSIIQRGVTDKVKGSTTQETDDVVIRTTQEMNNTTQETTQEKILALFRINSFITQQELAEKIGITQDGIKYHLQKLKTQGIIKHIGSSKTGQWKILK